MLYCTKLIKQSRVNAGKTYSATFQLPMEKKEGNGRGELWCGISYFNSIFILNKMLIDSRTRTGNAPTNEHRLLTKNSLYGMLNFSCDLSTFNVHLYISYIYRNSQ